LWSTALVRAGDLPPAAALADTPKELPEWKEAA
jgi:hypothetical protein